MKKNYTKTYWLVALIFALIVALVILTVFLIDGARDISSQIDTLNNNAQIISRDFEIVKGIPDTTVTIDDEYITIVLETDDCRLTAHYNKDMELLNTELLDMRIGQNIEALILLVVSMSAFAAVVGCVFTSIVISFYELYKKIVNKRRKA